MPLIDAADREQAVTDLATNLVVTAGAGTGKTSLMIERVLYLLVQAGVPLTELAVITFTEKAAAELRDRLEDGLERILEIEADPSVPRDVGQEADRVHARLDSGSREVASRRARQALDDLDRATVCTIHSLAGNLLRRHHGAAGVDVHFEVDADEVAADELFRELWARFLERSLGADDVPPAWEAALERFTMQEVETIAHELCRFGAADGVLDDSARDVQLDYAAACCRALLDELDRVRLDVADADRLGDSFTHSLDALERVLRGALEARSLPPADEISALRKKPSPGEKSGVRDVEGVKSALASIRERALRLARSDPGVPADLGELLGAFAREFRAEYLARGWISYDALIHLSRGLLRDDPTVRRSESRRFRALLVDEFQDTDPLQYEIIFFLAANPESTRRTRDAFEADLVPGKLFIVGDAKQSIYRFRGADIDAYHRAVETLKRGGGRVLTLRTNFRSVPGVIEPLNRLFATYFTPDRPSSLGVRDPRYDALSASRGPRSSRPSIEVWSVGDGGSKALERRQAEATALASWLDHELGRSRVRAGDVAVLFRALSEVDVYLRALRRYGIPYLVEGGRGFFRRYEVELLLACLRLVRDPADVVALVSCLRSPLGAVPDTELQLYAEERRAAENIWSLGARPDAARFPALERALRAFREFASRHRDSGIDRLAQAALDELPLRLAMSASYEGAQRVANLEKAVLHVCVLARDGRWSAEEILRRIEREDATEKQEADSPLADESVDAVRVLSIHKSKGLEWPVVVVPDLSREHGGRVGPATQVGVTSEARLPRALALRLGAVETPARIRDAEVGRDQERAEAKRLFYVATTRAKERLVLLVGGSREALGGRCEWIEALRAWGYEPEEAFAADGGKDELLREAVSHRRVTECDAPAARADEEELDTRLLEAAMACETVRQAMSLEKERGLEAPSRAQGEAAEERPGDLTGKEKEDGEIARAAGTAVHLLMEAWDGQDAEWLHEQARRAVNVAIGYEPLDAARVLDAVRSVVDAARRAGELDRIRDLDVLGKEVPLLYRDADGRLWDGEVDLVARGGGDGAASAPEVIDYKTDRAESAAELEDRHRAQLDIYAGGLQRAFGLDETPSRRIVWLRKE